MRALCLSTRKGFKSEAPRHFNFGVRYVTDSILVNQCSLLSYADLMYLSAKYVYSPELSSVSSFIRNSVTNMHSCFFVSSKISFLAHEIKADYKIAPNTYIFQAGA